MAFDISKYKASELSYIIEPKTEEEMIALSRAKQVIEILQKENEKLKADLRGKETENGYI